MDTEQLQQCHYSNVGMQADMVTLRDPDSIVLYDISAEASRLSLSVFGPTSRRFWLPEQPGLYPEQGGACPERSGSTPERSWSNPGAIRGHTLITHTQADMGSNKMRKAKPAFASHET